MSKQMDASEFLNIGEAAGYLRMSVAWLRAQVLNRKIPFYKLAAACDSAGENWRSISKIAGKKS
jgi:hypothetical protein